MTDVVQELADRNGVDRETFLKGQAITVAALREAGYNAKHRGPTGATVPSDTPCEVRLKASNLARMAIGRPTRTSEEWHATRVADAERWGLRFTCTCEGR